eukprot:gene7314-11633_t
MKQLLFVLFYLWFTQTKTQYTGRCSVYRNNFMDLTDVENCDLVQVTTSFCESNTQGFSAFSFSKSANPKDITCDYFYHKSKRYFGSMTKNCSDEYDETAFNYIRGSWDITVVSIKIPQQIINSSNFIIFRCDEDINNFTKIFTTLNIEKSFAPCNPFYCSKTFGSINLYYYIFEQTLFGFFVLFSIIALWRSWQPFTSRGVIMTMGICTEFLAGFVDILPYVSTVETAYKYENNIFLTVTVPLKMAAFLLIQINFLRMFLILFIHKNMDALHENTISPWSIKFIRFLKYASSGIGALVFGLILFLGHSLVFVLIIWGLGSFDQSAGDNFIPMFIWAQYNRFYDAFLIVSILAFVLFDFSMNFRDFFCNCRKYWIKTDPFRFRMQQFTLILLLACVCIKYVYREIMRAQSTDYSMLQCLSTDFHSLEIVIETLTNASYVFYFTGFILSYTLIKKIMVCLSCCRKHNKMDLDTIEEIFSNEEKLKLFNDFVKSEFSFENVFLFEDIKRYQIMDDEDDRRELGRDIFKKYLNGQASELEANISGSIIKEVQNEMYVDHFEPNLFDGIPILGLSPLQDIIDFN